MDNRSPRTWISRCTTLIATAVNKGKENLYKCILHSCKAAVWLWPSSSSKKPCRRSLRARHDVLQAKDNVKAVQDIVDLIARNKPISVVSRWMDWFKKVTNCKKRNIEDTPRFVSRFHGIDAEQPMRAGCMSSSQTDEFLAIKLFNNANLSESTLENVKVRIIGMAE